MEDLKNKDGNSVMAQFPKILPALVLSASLMPQGLMAQESTNGHNFPVFDVFACDRLGTAYLEKSSGAVVLRTIRHVIESTLESAENRCEVLQIVRRGTEGYISEMFINMRGRPVYCEEDFLDDAGCEIPLMGSEVEQAGTALGYKVFEREAVFTQDSIGDYFAVPTTYSQKWAVLRLDAFNDHLAVFQIVGGQVCEGASGSPVFLLKF